MNFVFEYLKAYAAKLRFSFVCNKSYSVRKLLTVSSSIYEENACYEVKKMYRNIVVHPIFAKKKKSFKNKFLDECKLHFQYIKKLKLSSLTKFQIFYYLFENFMLFNHYLFLLF